MMEENTMKVREYTVREEIYSFNELSESAKENARQKYLESFRETDMFSEMLQDDLKEIFPKSDLQVKYSLSCCQGDGLDVYGIFYISDICEYVRLSKDYESLSDKEKRFLNFLAKRDFTIKCNDYNTYCYYTSKVSDIQWNIEYDLESEYFRDIPYDTIEKIVKIFDDRLQEYCSIKKKEGYDFFYTADDDEIIEVWETNDYEGFTKNGDPVYV